ncbi:MAG: hypothetical protein GXY91_00035, partial [Clostridia bacterium]|nr:hypothetical protein [Clostridia bacterium]
AKKSGMVAFTGCAILGIVLSRVNVIFVGMYDALGPGYVPSWIEWGISIGLFAAVVLAYTFIVENFAVFSPSKKPAAKEEEYTVSIRKQEVSWQTSK